MDAVSAEILAKFLGISSTQVSSFARRGVMVRARKGFDLEQSVRSYCQHLREQATGRKAMTPDSDRGRLARAQAASVEQRMAQKAGKLVEADAVESAWTGIAKTIRAGVMRLPRRAGARLGLTPEQVSALDDEARAVLSEIADG